MPNISKEKPDKMSVHSMPPGTADFPSWWNSSVSQFPQSFSNSGQSLNMNSPPEPLHNVKQIDFQLPFHESSSTRPMADSHPELTTTHGAGYTRPYEKQVEDQTKSVLSLGTSNFIFPTSQVGYSNSLVHIPYACSDPYYGGLFAPSGAHSLVHPQMVTMAPVRVPLPHDLAEHEPIYVNAKQYNAILRRRQTRAKLEAQNKLVKDRKPYLHESRHRHAMKRVRGSGGRFLSKNELQLNHSSSPVSGCRDTSKLGLPLLCINHLESKVIELDTSNVGACSTSCSDVSSISNGDDIPPTQPDRRFSSYSPGGGIMYNGSQQYPPNIR